MISPQKYRCLIGMERVKKIFTTSLTSILCIVAFTAEAQLVLERSVIGSMGSDVALNGGIVLEYTVGESVIATVGNGNSTLTQGFHQSGLFSPLNYDLNITDATCPSASNGMVVLTNVRGCSPPYTVQWSTGEEGLSIDRLTPGLYNFTLTGGDCELTTEFEIGSGTAEACRLRFFNAFSPNGDGNNDLWTIENINLPEFTESEVKIFNRWGQKVHEFDNYDNVNSVWNGNTESGDALPSGTYFYIAEVDGTTYKGYIELIR